MGYEKYKSGESNIFGDYLNTRKIEELWFNEFKVSYYHRPLSEIIGYVIKSGFVISDFIEPKPLKAVAKESQRWFDTNSKIPLFMIFELKKCYLISAGA